jgi:hypothetical protein
MKRGRKPTAAPKPEGGGSQALHMTFRLSPELRGRLITAAGERPIGDEIRRRLERSFVGGYEPPLDRRSLALLDGIVAAINTLGSEGVNALISWRLQRGVPREIPSGFSELGPWHSDPNAFVALQSTIEFLLQTYRPEGEPDDTVQEVATYTAVGAAILEMGKRDPETEQRWLGEDEEDQP